MKVIPITRESNDPVARSCLPNGHPAAEGGTDSVSPDPTSGRRSVSEKRSSKTRSQLLQCAMTGWDGLAGDGQFFL